jgi:hypothetical protein
MLGQLSSSPSSKEKMSMTGSATSLTYYLKGSKMGSNKHSDEAHWDLFEADFITAFVNSGSQQTAYTQLEKCKPM